MKMGRLGVWLQSICALLCSAFVQAEELAGVDVARIHRIIDMGYGLSSETEEEIAALAREFPESPVPYLLDAGRLYWLQNYAGWDEARKSAFEAAAEVSLEKAKAFAKGRKRDRDAGFLLAMNEMLQVIYLVDEKRWWSAFWKMRPSMRALRRLVAAELGYHDAKLPLGLANCYLSDAPAYLKPLAKLSGFRGNSELGLRYLREVKTNGLFSRVDASYHYGLIHEEVFDDLAIARVEFEELVGRFPGNVRFQAVLGEFERRTGDRKVARERLERLRADGRLAEFPQTHVEALISLMWCGLDEEDWELAISASEEAQLVGQAFAPESSQAFWASYGRAEVEARRGDLETARELFAAIATFDDKMRKTLNRRLKELRPRE